MFTLLKCNDTAIARLPKIVSEDLGSAPFRVLHQAIQTDVYTLVLDMSDVQFLDGSALNQLRELCEKADDLQRKVIIKNSRPQPSQMMSFTPHDRKVFSLQTLGNDTTYTPSAA